MEVEFDIFALPLNSDALVGLRRDGTRVYTVILEPKAGSLSSSRHKLSARAPRTVAGNTSGKTSEAGNRLIWLTWAAELLGADVRMMRRKADEWTVPRKSLEPQLRAYIRKYFGAIPDD